MGMTALRESDGKRRFVSKNGVRNIKVLGHPWTYFKDLHTSLLAGSWAVLIIVAALLHWVSWLVFAVSWYIVSVANGDLDDTRNSTQVPCITEIYGFGSSVLFSIETQHTIGYGSRHPTGQCPVNALLLTLQSLVGNVLVAYIFGLVLSKLASPLMRKATILFSEQMALSEDRQFLCFRVANLRLSQLVFCYVRVNVMIKKNGSWEQHNLKIMDSSSVSHLASVIPTIVKHKIDEESPLHGMMDKIGSMDKMGSDGEFEVIVVFGGSIEITGKRVEAMTSYLPSEIVMGDFKPLLSLKKPKFGDTVDWVFRYLNTWLSDPISTALFPDRRRSYKSSGFTSDMADMSTIVPPSASGGQSDVDDTSEPTDDRAPLLISD